MPRRAPKTGTHFAFAPPASEKKPRSEDEKVSVGRKKKNGGPRRQQFSPTQIGAGGQLLRGGHGQRGT